MLKYFTSNFANNGINNLGGISISRYPATRQGFSGPEFPPLFPTAQLLSQYKNGLSWEDYTAAYEAQLMCLDFGVLVERLEEIAIAEGSEAVVLLCYESAKTLDTNPCHRRLVAKWIEDECNIEIPEWHKGVSLT